MRSPRIADPSQPTTPRGRSQPELISRKMPPNQVASILVQHGVDDVSDKLDFKRWNLAPFANGGFGSVYRGTLHDGQLVAIKRIDMQGVRGETDLGGKRCKHAAHELYTWSKCDHSGVLKALGFVLFEELILIVSPWVPNGALTSYLEGNDACDKLQLCIDVAKTVEYLHEEGIVHGDIKGDNILVSDDNNIQFVDFGNATLVRHRTVCFTRTSSSLACSVRFSAPEILDGTNEKYTTESDVYALGMTILQILTGKLPYAGDSELPALAKIFRGVPPPRPDWSGVLQSSYAEGQLWSMLSRCWKHDSTVRPTAREVKQTLIEIKWESNNCIDA